MAVIYTFPTKATPLGADLVLISDSEDDSNTKNATIASMVASNAIDVVDTVTASGAGITASPNKGDVIITNTGVTTLAAGSGTSVSSPTGSVTISTPTYSGGSIIGHVPTGGTSSTFLRGDGTWVVPAGSGSNPGGSTGSVQFKNSEGAFAGDGNLLFNSGTLTVGEAGGDKGIVKIEAEDGVGSGILKIGHQNVSNYVSLGLGDGTMSSDYSIKFPVASPGGNNKILESNSSGQLSWISTPTGDTYSAGDGLDLTGTTFSTDLKVNGGLVIQSTELAVDLAATAITGFLGVADGGTGVSLSVAATYNALVGNGDAFVETANVETAMLLPVGATSRRPNASAANVGLIRYNSQTTNFEVCKETAAASGQYSWYTIDVTIITG